MGERFIPIGTDQYATRNAYDVNNRLQYVGECLAPVQNQGNTPAWRIKRYAYEGVTTRIVSILWADGSQAFDKAWNLRATYTY
jgi:hypothetical protein